MAATAKTAARVLLGQIESFRLSLFCDRIKPVGDGRTRDTAKAGGDENGAKAPVPSGFLTGGRETELLLSDQDVLQPAGGGRHAAKNRNNTGNLNRRFQSLFSRPA
jgi:hypothetical protein